MFATLLPAIALCQQPVRHQQVLQLVEEHSAYFSGISKTIWDYAELGYHEEKSSALLRRELEAAGFRVQSPAADEPTAFVAMYGQGEPVIGILENLTHSPAFHKPPRRTVAP
jgi:aminobenzoyl-glutamate utilization protein B